MDKNEHYNIYGLPDKLRFKIFNRDKDTCRYCGTQWSLKNLVRMTVDHVIPKSKGGTHDETNLVTACNSCNSSKNGRTPEEWRK